jgi:hypothetical protein
MKCIMNPTKKLETTTQSKPKPVNILTVSDKFGKKICNEKLKKPLSKSNTLF